MSETETSTAGSDTASFHNDPVAERNVVIFAYALDGKGGATAIREPSPRGDAPTWFHIDYSAPQAVRWLTDVGLPEEAIQSVVSNETRPRTVVTSEGTLIFLRGVNLNPGADPEDMVSIRLWVQPDRVVSVRRRRLLAAQDVQAELERGHGPRDVPEVVIHLVERLAARIAEYVDDIEERVIAFEAEIASGNPISLAARLSEIRRETSSVRRYLAPQRDALETLSRHSAGLLSEEQAFALREQTDRITRNVEDLDLVREHVQVLKEELLNRVAQEQNARVYVLSIVAAIFLPITFITGIFGMNVAGLPGIENPVAFWLVAGAMTVISVSVVILLRLKRWL